MKDHQTKAVILAGGRGTRLHPFSFTIPKPLMPIGEDPILLHLINRFKQFNINHFLVATGYQSELIKAYIGTGERFGATVEYFHEEGPLGTAGPLSLMRERFLDDEYFFLINGDIYTEMDFDDMRKFALNSRADVVVGYVEKKEKSSFGVLNIENQAITKIIEKPERTFCISSGIYMIHSRALKRIPHARFFTMPDLINSHLAEGLKVGAYPINRFWLGIEDVENMEEVLNRIKLIAPESSNTNGART